MAHGLMHAPEHGRLVEWDWPLSDTNVSVASARTQDAGRHNYF